MRLMIPLAKDRLSGGVWSGINEITGPRYECMAVVKRISVIINVHSTVAENGMAKNVRAAMGSATIMNGSRRPNGELTLSDQAPMTGINSSPMRLSVPIKRPMAARDWKNPRYMRGRKAL